MNFLFILLIQHSLEKSKDEKICPDASLIYSSSFLDTSEFKEKFQEFVIKEPPQKFAGKGHFSIVRKTYLKNGQAIAVKEFRRFHKNDLIKELSILRALRNVDHVVKFIGLSGTEKRPIVLYSYHNSSQNCYNNITLPQFKWWLKTLLETISEIHSKGIFHRDLKLGNILTDFENKELTIIDFGLGEFNVKNSYKNPHAGCFRLKAPELAIEMNNFDCSIDIWSIGIVCLDLMINLKSNWVVKDNQMLLDKLISYFGSQKWNKFAKKYNQSYLIDHEVIGDIFELALPGNYDIVTPESLDLVSKFLKFDPEERITAKEALMHPFFNDL